MEVQVSKENGCNCTNDNNDGSIFVFVYKKPTHTDQYLNFFSNHPSNTKDAVISALFWIAKAILSDSKDLDKQIK